MGSSIRDIISSPAQQELPIPIAWWDNKIVYLCLGFIVGALTTYLLSKIWSGIENDSSPNHSSSLAGRASTQPLPSPRATSPSKPAVPKEHELDPALSLAPEIPVKNLATPKPDFEEIKEKFKTNSLKVFGIERLDLHLIFKKSTRSEYFNPPVFFQEHIPFIRCFQALREPPSESITYAAKLGHDHLRWIIARDALEVQKRIGNNHDIPVPTYPLEFSSLEEMEKAAEQIETWKMTHVSKLQTIKFLDLSNLALTSVPDFINSLTSAETLDLSENQLHALPFFLASFPATYKIAITNNPISVATLGPFKSEVNRIRSQNPRFGPLIISER